MKYLLVLGFACNVYRREPRARIYVGDQLIDEFHISNTSDNLLMATNKFFEIRHPLQPFQSFTLYNLHIKNFPPLKFCELEIDKKIKHLTLRIKIDNNDSNYSNGFMTYSTLIKLTVCCCFPLDKRVLSRLKKIKNKNRIDKNYAWYRSNKNYIFDLVRNGMCWKGVNGQKFETNKNFLLAYHEIGGDGEFFCQLNKKYGIFISKLFQSYRYNFRPTLIDYLLNKYKQYEN
jgi:hypothetical protein